MTSPMDTHEGLLAQNREDAEQFCRGAFGPFVADVSQYVEIVAKLMDRATDRAFAAPAQASQEPVAYRWRFNDKRAWNYCRSRPDWADDADIVCEALSLVPSTDRGGAE